MMKITGLSHLFKWENLHNWWLTKYFFLPHCICNLAWVEWSIKVNNGSMGERGAITIEETKSRFNLTLQL